MFQTKSLIVAIVGFALSILYGKIFSQELFYSNNFEGLVDTEWSNKRTDVTPVGGRRFLGQFGNGTVSLTLPNIPFHKQVRVSFDLFIIRSWDGNYQRDPRFPNLVVGPDVWSLSVAGGSQLVRTTFSNIDSNPPLSYNQAYPENYPDGNNPPRTGSTEINTLGYHFDYGGDKDAGDTVYRFESSFPHTTSSLKMQFNASGLQSLEDESWGLDNVKVELISENQPPVITHTPITSAIQGKEIWFSMDVVDDQDQLKTLAIYARITGERDFTSYPFVVSQGQTKYDMGISSLTQTLDGVEYYIEATDEQGLVGYHRSDDGAHFICVTDPNKKTPVIIIPGIMGTELYDDEKNELIWIDPKNILSLRDLYLLRLMLQRDGITPDRRNRCSRDLNSTCTNVLECPHLPIPSVDCVDGGRNIRVGQIVNINECCFLEGFTAYKELVRFLERNGYRFNKDLFLFGYDWRIDIGGKNQGEKSAVNVLHNIIESLTPNCEDKVNIIAHSMGGLLTRSYLQQYADRRIGTVIYLGTPRLGSPKAYAVLRWKESIFSSAILRSLLERETMSFITQNFPSVYQLLPHNDFFVQQDETFEDLEVTLGKLSNQGLVARAREFYEEIKDYNPVKRSFAINGSGQNTPSNFRVNKKGDVEVSPDLRGDGTVPNNSSSGFIGTKDFFVNGKHDDLPGIQAVQEKILKILEGSENDIVSGIQSSPYESPELYKWKTLSPVTVKITDALGNFTGRDENDDIREDIPESQFFVFDHNEGGFLPRDGEYRVEIHALDTGRFTLQFDTIDADGNIPETIAYQEIPISSNGKGELLLSPHISSHQLMLDVDGDRDHDFILEPQQAVPTQLQEMFVERGDVNKDKRIDISDAVSILEYMFSGSSIACPNGANANNDSRSDISDAIYILGYLFLGTERKPEGLIFCP